VFKLEQMLKVHCL